MNAPARITIVIDGARHDVADGVPLGSVLHTLGNALVRRTSTGAARGIFCGMGLCFECLVVVDGQPGVRACITAARDGMRVEREIMP